MPSSKLIALVAALSLGLSSPAMADEPEPQSCEKPTNLADVLAELERAPERIMGFDATATEEDLRAITRQLPCLEENMGHSQLARLWYIRGIARLYAMDEQAEPDRAGPASVMQLFQIAHQVDGSLRWDSQNFGDYGLELWDEAVSAWDKALTQSSRLADPSDGYWISLEKPGDIPGQIFLDGRAIHGGQAPAVIHEGIHLIQQELDGKWYGQWFTVSAGTQWIRLPLEMPAMPIVLSDANPPKKSPAEKNGEGGSQVATQNTAATGSKAPSTASEEKDLASGALAPPDPSDREEDRGLQWGLMLGSHEIPQLYAGPQLLLRYALNRHLLFSASTGVSAGSLLDCENCQSVDSLSYIVPVHVLAQYRHWAGPVEFNVGAGYLGFYGGNFGALNDAPAAATHGVTGMLAAVAGRSRTRFIVQLTSGYLMAPDSLSGLSHGLSFGILRTGGRRP